MLHYVKVILALASVSTLAACATGPELAPGEARMVLSYPRGSDCTVQGANMRVEKRENMLGRGLTASGPMRSSVIVCTTPDGQQLTTTDHRQLFSQGNYASLILYEVQAGTTRASGEAKRGTAIMTFWTDVEFSSL